MTLRPSFTVALLVPLLGVPLLAVSCSLPAQQAATPTLADILQRLDVNLNRYDNGVPSFFCDEHAVSQVEPGLPIENTVTDSVFRLKRTPNPDHTTTLVESRVIQNADGKATTSQKMDGPTLLNGVFEGGLAIVSVHQTACMNYTLQRTRDRRAGQPYTVRFATVLTPQNSAACLLQENSSGSATIDSASMQITHLELTTPHHVIIEGTPYRAAVVGKRVIQVDYAPVWLGGEDFWLPSSIAMRATSGSGTFHEIAWLFRASYRNYHKLEVTSRVLPGFETPAP